MGADGVQRGAAREVVVAADAELANAAFRALRHHGQHHGPGVIVSEQLDSRFPTVADRENFVRMHVPAGHFGEPRDLAVLVALLASPLGRYISGEVIAVDGGIHRFAF